MRILLVEDEEKVGSFILQGLQQASYSVMWVRNGEEALNEIACRGSDAMVVDIKLPGMDGLELVRRIRGMSNTIPILALSAHASTHQRIESLNSGFDDFLPKPFAFVELLARLRALLRRRNGVGATSLSYGGLVVDQRTRMVYRDNVPIELTRREYALLMELMQAPGRVFLRAELFNSVWGYSQEANSNLVTVYMKLLRRKIDDQFESSLLHTVRNAGYVLQREAERRGKTERRDNEPARTA